MYWIKEKMKYNYLRIALLINIIVMLFTDTKKFLCNVNLKNIALFVEQFRRIHPSYLEYKIRRKIGSQNIKLFCNTAYNKKHNYFSIFRVVKQHKHVLVIDISVPAYDKNSSGLRMYTILNILNELGCKITFMAAELQPREPYVTELRAIGIEVICEMVDMEKYLRENGPSYDIVILSEPYPAFDYISLIRAYAVNSTVIYDTVDVHWLRIERAAAVTGDTKLLKEAEYIKKLELLNIKASDIVLTVTKDEKNYLHKLDSNLKIEVIPNIHEINNYEIKPFQSRNDLMFIGHFLHQPNVDAVKYFVKEILPLIKTQIPTIKFYIVGTNPTREVLNLRSDDVNVTGYVKDIAPYFENCRVFVAPLRFGAGMKGKIGQSMMYGLPVVTTTIGAEGMGLDDGRNVLIADNPENFAEAVLSLYSNEKLWTEISVSSMKHIDQNYSRECISLKLAELLGSLS
ncbi:glycosyltransferase [Geotalea uraniireducens]|uniref:Glycosyl transferase, group 1 n=1 Tax=Geotalea uraniireducens (strain Rf4) TaxID=351605 RepID=A5G6B2_GEOUR|nr:glycosyltransferase [Geotalea uraniireducens]ABQ27330.1 glycosyl transferase, group 1 [Geotalea uraniireducens Rf4]